MIKVNEIDVSFNDGILMFDCLGIMMKVNAVVKSANVETKHTGDFEMTVCFKVKNTKEINRTDSIFPYIIFKD